MRQNNAGNGRPSIILTERTRILFPVLGLASLLLFGCTNKDKQESSQERYDKAKVLFEQATRDFHLSAGEAKGAVKQDLLARAAVAYDRLQRDYPEQDYWAARALRNLGNIRAMQTNVNEAVQLYAAVETKYAGQDFEVLMAWKSAADLLWDAGRHDQARVYYQKLVARFDTANASQVVQMAVRGSKSRLAGRTFARE